MDHQEQESLWKQAGDLAHRMLIRKLSMQIRKEVPAQGDKIEIPHPDKLKHMGEGESAIGGEGQQ